MSDPLRSTVKDKLASGGVVSSMTVRLVPSVEIVSVIKTAGFDSFYIDLEHSPLSIETTNQIATTAIAAGIDCIARVPANTPEYISRVLDGGCMGVIAPGVTSAEEARRVVDAAKYPPTGRRGVSGALPQVGFRSMPQPELYAAINAVTTVIVMFESAVALEAADEIAGADGVDMVMIGTNDLLADLGLPGQFDHDAVRGAYARTIEACAKHGKHVGVGGLASRPDLVAQFVKMGARYVSTGTDLNFLLAAATEKAKAVAKLEV
ncbi:MAG: aldolase/citrate lyase family protein [Rickettsiales bacterium]